MKTSAEATASRREFRSTLRRALGRASVAALVGTLLWGVAVPVHAIVITEFRTNEGVPRRIAAGPDGNLWFTESASNKIGRITPAGVITEFAVPTPDSQLYGIAAGPDGNLWFTEQAGNKIGKITPAGVITEYALPTAASAPLGITAGPDGALWFTELDANKIGRITPAGVITEYAVPTANSRPYGIALGSDGALWFTESRAAAPGGVDTNKIGRITPDGVITEYPVPPAFFGSQLFDIAAGPDGALWFREFDFGPPFTRPSAAIGRITTAGVVTYPGQVSGFPADLTAGPDGAIWFTQSPSSRDVFDTIGRLTPEGARTEFALPSVRSDPTGIAAGPDGALWFTESRANKIGRITTAGVVTEYVLPATRAPTSYAFDIVAGSDGAMWFTSPVDTAIGRITADGAITEYPVPTTPGRIAAGPDDALWFTDNSAAGTIRRITTAGVVTEYPALSTGLGDIVAGPDGALWFMEPNANRIGRITTAGTVTEYAIPTPFSGSNSIAAGPDGALWFTEESANKIGRITTAGVITEYALPSFSQFGRGPGRITTGPDGALWFTERYTHMIGRITTGGTITEYPIPTAHSGPEDIVAGPDGALWFTEDSANKIGRITTAGVITEYALPSSDFVSSGNPYAIAAGPGGLWFTEPLVYKIGRLTLSASATVAAVLPLSRSVQVGASATAFTSIINAGIEAALNCAPAPPSVPPAGLGTFIYQTTDANNALVGAPNIPADIAAGAIQHYVFGFSPTAAIAETSLAMRFVCDNAADASPIPGVNNFFVVASTTAVPDTIALMATVSGDGVVRIPGSDGTQLFAIGTSNVGATGTIVVSGDTSGSALPVTLTVCETTGGSVCLAPPTPTVTVNYAAGTSRSFALFARASGFIPLDPANNRVFARLTESGVLRGATSAAVCTTPNAAC